MLLKNNFTYHRGVFVLYAQIWAVYFELWGFGVVILLMLFQAKQSQNQELQT